MYRTFQKLNANRFTPDPKPEKVEKKKHLPIKKLSDKRKKQNDVYLVLRKEFLEKNPYCQIRFAGCTNLSVDVHHSEGRIGKLLTDVEHFVSTCRNCHRITHDE